MGHARQAAMAELSGSQPSGPSQSSMFNPGEPPPPQEGVLAARNVEETFVWVLRRRGGNTFDLASSVLEELGEGGDGEDE